MFIESNKMVEHFISVQLVEFATEKNQSYSKLHITNHSVYLFG